MNPPPIRRRTRAREIALQLLYQADLCSEPAPDAEERIREESRGDNEVVSFATRLVEGTLLHRDEIDLTLRRIAANWDLPRMATVDRNILRLAVFELGHCADVPPKVTINEAIELGKRFSTAKSGSFINGILDRVRVELQNGQKSPQKAVATPPAAAPRPAASGGAAETSATEGT